MKEYFIFIYIAIMKTWYETRVNIAKYPSKMRHSFSLISFSHKYLTQICTWHGNFLDVFSFSAVWSILCMFRRNRARWSFKVVSHSINDSDIHRAAQISVLSTAYSRQIMCKYHDGIKIYSSFRILLAFFFTLSH